MCSPQCVLEKIADKIADIVIQSVGNQLGYVFHYKKNMKNLQVETDELQELITSTEGEIVEAKARGEVIFENVLDWLNGAKDMRQGVQTFMEEKAAKENNQCFKFSCPSYCSRYSLSKVAEKKMGDMKSTIARKAKLGMISHPAPIPLDVIFSSSEEYRSFDSRKEVVQKIVEALKDSTINVIGVYGPGGVGKTTMVEMVGKQVKIDGLFDEVVMAVVSKDANVGKIQEALAEQLYLKLEKKTEKVKAGEIWNRFNNGKKNLVILDDVWEELDLKEIGVPITDGNNGCKVMLTSRNKCGLKNRQVDKEILIHVLSDEEAWNLFKEKVGEKVEQGELHQIAMEVCKQCGGLPVAIIAVGAALKNKSMPDWRVSLDKLRKSMLEDIDKRLVSSLRLSYDHLESKDAKSCFLLCCLYPEDAQIPIQELVRHYVARRLLGQNPDKLEEARDIVCSAVNTLKTSSLLLEGKDNDFVKMHDVIRDVAILIAKEKETFLVTHGVKEWPESESYEKYSAISLRSKTIPELPNELVCPELHTLMLESPRLEIPDRFFIGTKKLVVLELHSVVMLRLPSSLGELTELRMLCLYNCKLGDIAMLKYLKNKLEVLSLQYSDIKALPHEVGELTRLRLLDMRDCGQLVVIPSGVISKLVRLEELYFPSRFTNWEDTTGNEEKRKVSPDELTSLTRLSALDICVRYLRQLPVDLFFQNLIRFCIGVGFGMPYVYGFYSRQGVMLIEHMWSDDDSNIWERQLGKSKCFKYLTQLQIQECGSLKYLFTPSSARELQQLQSLEIEGCEILESVIRNEGETDEEILENVINFSQLKILVLSGLPCLRSFYPGTTGSQSLPPSQGLFNGKVALPALEEINIRKVPTITAIWDMQTFLSQEKAANSSLSRLRTMKIVFCSNLVNVVQGFPNMGVTGTGKQVDNYVLQFPELRSLNLESLERLSSFNDTSLVTQTRPLFNHQVALPALEEINIRKVPTITAIWDMQTFLSQEKAANSSLSRFRTMKIDSCSNLVNVVQGFPNMGVTGTGKQVDNYILQFPELWSLELESLERLSSFNDTSLVTQTRPLFNHQVALPALEKIYIYDVPTITTIWDMQTFSSPNEAANPSLSKLRTIQVEYCDNLANLVEGFPHMPMTGTKKEEEKQVDNYVLQFPQLRSLVVRSSGRSSSQTRPLFNHQVAFHALEKLSIVSVQNITEIFDKSVLPTTLFGELSFLTIRSCEKLINVVSSHFLPLVLNMESLEIGNCPAMEIIAVIEKRGEETKEATNKDIIQFSKLTELTLVELENLKGFCAYSSEDQLYFNMPSTLPALKDLRIESLPMITAVWGMQKFLVPENTAESSFSQSRINETSLITEIRPLFNYQVQFSPLEKLYILSMPNLTEIWGEDLLPTMFFGQMRSLAIQGCEKLLNVVPSHMLPLIQNIESLIVQVCSKMEVIIVLEKKEEETKEATKKVIIEFPKLDELVLRQLEKLKGVCAYKSGDHLSFDVQVAFPKLVPRWSRLDTHSTKIIKEAVSGNEEMLDVLAKCDGWKIEDDSEDKLDVMEDQEDVSGDADKETHKKEKAGPSQKRPTETATRTPLPDKDDLEDHSNDEDEEIPKKAGLGQMSMTKAAIKTLAPNKDGFEDEDNFGGKYEETPNKAGPSKKKPIESATKTSFLSEDDKEDEDEETPKKAKVAQREEDD